MSPVRSLTKHFVAYGQSDQASFRAPAVRAWLDYMLVPGTIAAYYSDATAAFVLSSDLEYCIDPRTPLYQGTIGAPRASHFSLAKFMGPSIAGLMGDSDSPRRVSFEPATYTGEVVGEVVEGILNWQRHYGGRAPAVQHKLDRYRRILVESNPELAAPDSITEPRPPSFLLSPYFALRSVDDPWAPVMREVWHRCAEQPDAPHVSPVIAVASIQVLREMFRILPSGLSEDIFVWITGWDERTATEKDLRMFKSAVAEMSESCRPINLYGSFFSDCLSSVGLFGFSSGLGYSESRNWPELSSTGAAPARYYMRDLHMFVAPAVGQLIVDLQPTFACDCEFCLGGARSIVSLGYHELKAHFAHSRRWETDLVSEGLDRVIDSLTDAHGRFEGSVRGRLPERMTVRIGHLLRWADALT